MTSYKLILTYTDHAQPVQLNISLTKTQEDYPEMYFSHEAKENIRTTIQKQTACAVMDNHLNKIITSWIQDIKEGYPESKVKINLPSLLEVNFLKICDCGNQDIPDLFEPQPSDFEPLWGASPPLNFS